MAYVSNGTLTTGKRTVDDFTTWDTQTDWEAFQSKSNIAINSGALELAQITQPSSGVSRWTFDADDTSSGTAIDVWGNNAGDITGATTSVSGANQTYTTNEAYSFDGTGDFVSVGDVYDSASGSFSFAGWFYVDSYDGAQTIVGNWESGGPYQHVLRVNSGGSLEFLHNYSGGSDAVSVAAPAAGNWGFAFCYYAAGGEIGVSVDAGARSTQATSGPPLASTVNEWEIARQPSSAAGYWDGDLDDLRVYSKVLTTTEESDLYNTGSIL